MIVDFRSKDCIVMLTTFDYEHFAKIAMSYILKYTDFDIVLYTEGYASTIRNSRIEIRKFDFADGSHSFKFFICKPYIALDMIENSDYDRMLFFDTDMIFTPQIANVFDDVMGYLDNFPLYVPAPLADPYVLTKPNNSRVDTMSSIPEFMGKLYIPEYNSDIRIWWRQGNAFMFNKGCKSFYQEVICQIKTATSHSTQSKLIKGEGEYVFPVAYEEGYINATLWKYNEKRRNMWESSSYFPLRIQEVLLRPQYKWLGDDHQFDESEITLRPRHPLWKRWLMYPNKVGGNSQSRLWGGFPFDEKDNKVSPYAYHFSGYPQIGQKDYMLQLHDQLGGHDESIFNC
tara:strand:- start:352 stop:1380 length:1029 start_codon:yes stop_codon:yes gene_type:complete